MTIQENDYNVYERTYRYYACDFETTVFEGQTYTEVWSAAVIELWTEQPYIFHSIGEMFDYFLSLNDNLILYFHNEKFDGSFILPYLISDLQYEQAFDENGAILPPSQMYNNTFNYSISEMGQWYKITIKHNNKIIEIRDSLKLLPFSLKVIGKSFNTQHQKLEMEYEGFRFAGCEITPEEQAYIENDVFVLKEALEIMFAQGHNKLTIGSCCMAEYMSIVDKWDWEHDFPNLYEEPLPEEYGSPTIGDYIHKSYRGGWTYLVKGKECKLYKNGCTCDVNSLYPSVMHSESGSYYPVGLPTFWLGDTIPAEALKYGRYYFLRIRTRFYIKPNYLPFIQIKHSPYYKPTECLETSDVLVDGNYCQFIEKDGKVIPTTVEMTVTCTDWELIKEHYYLEDCEILSGCWFYAKMGIFDEYINKYKEIKMNSKGAVRQIAKLFLNNLYGKMATSTDSSHKLAYLDDDKILQFETIVEYDKKPGYIPIGSAITSYARNFTIRAAQKNYYGKDKRGFIYADTDSIHCDLLPTEVMGITIHPTDFCCWKCESSWDEGWYVRQKTYIEHITHNDEQPVDPYYDIKCAGMPQRCKDRIIKKFNNIPFEEHEGENIPSNIQEFNRGIKVFGKLMPRRIQGGTVLIDTMYEMR